MLKVIKFKAEWCGPCKQLEKVFQELLPNLQSVEYLNIDVDQVPQAALDYNVSALPTVLFIKDGQIVDRSVGVKHKSYYLNTLERLR